MDGFCREDTPISINTHKPFICKGCKSTRSDMAGAIGNWEGSVFHGSDKYCVDCRDELHERIYEQS